MNNNQAYEVNRSLLIVENDTAALVERFKVRRAMGEYKLDKWREAIISFKMDLELSLFVISFLNKAPFLLQPCLPIILMWSS